MECVVTCLPSVLTKNDLCDLWNLYDGQIMDQADSILRLETIFLLQG